MCWPRRHAVVLVVAAVVLILGIAGIGYWRRQSLAPDYSGQARTVTVEFGCLNGIFWDDPASEYMWWAGEAPTLPSEFNIYAPAVGATSNYSVSGVLRFDSASEATLTGDGGGTLLLTRQPVGRPYQASCALAPTAP